MLYLHHNTAIHAQGAFSDPITATLIPSVDNQLPAKEPVYEGIPANQLRRMGRSTRMSVGAALKCLQEAERLDGILFGTANGGMEDCIKFMEQIVKYEEQDLTPGNFVQSTPNGIAAQIALIKQNRAYNITHAHRGLSFEMALLDAMLLARENPEHQYLIGGVDEISSYNFRVDALDGWIKKETVSNLDLYNSSSAGSIAGEGVACFLGGGTRGAANCAVKAIHTLHTSDLRLVREWLNDFIQTQSQAQLPDLLLSGENGDQRYLPFYQEVESILNRPIARFKHLFGEYGTASAQALHLATKLLDRQEVPPALLKRENTTGAINSILIYNNYKATQHSLVLVTRC